MVFRVSGFQGLGFFVLKVFNSFSCLMFSGLGLFFYGFGF